MVFGGYNLLVANCLGTIEKGETAMKAGMYITGSGPVLILTSHKSLVAPKLIEKLRAKGIRKFIAYEVPVEWVKQKYGNHYQVVMNDLKQEDDLRVMDYNGHHVFQQIVLGDLGEPICHED